MTLLPYLLQYEHEIFQVSLMYAILVVIKVLTQKTALINLVYPWRLVYIYTRHI